MRVPILILAMGLALAVPQGVMAQGRGHGSHGHEGRGREARARGAQVRGGSAAWDVARQGRRDDDRYDDDWDDDDGRRGGSVYDRTGGVYGDRCDALVAQLQRQHDQWHSKNDRHMGNNGYQHAHANLHNRIDRKLERSGCSARTSRSRTLGDIILSRDPTRRLPGPTSRIPGGTSRVPDRTGRIPDRTGRIPDRTGGTGGGVLDRIPRSPTTRQQAVSVDRLTELLDRLLGAGG